MVNSRKKWWLGVLSAVVGGLILLAASRLWPDATKVPVHNGDVVAHDKIGPGVQVGDNIGGHKVAPVFAPRFGDEVHGDKNVHVGDNNLTLNVPPVEQRPAAAPESKPPFDPKLRVAPTPPKPAIEPPPTPAASSTAEARDTGEPVTIIALAEKPHEPQVFNENLGEAVSLEAKATGGATAALTPITATATAGTVTASALSVLEPECGTAAFGASQEDVVLTVPPPHGNLLCHVRVQRTGYPDITREILVPAEE